MGPFKNLINDTLSKALEQGSEYLEFTRLTLEELREFLRELEGFSIKENYNRLEILLHGALSRERFEEWVREREAKDRETIEENARLLAELQRERDAYQEAQRHNEGMAIKLDRLTGERDLLEGERRRLEGEKSQLEGERDQLEGERDQLEGERDQLEHERDRLERERGWLESEKTDLSNELTSLRKDHKNLEHSLEVLSSYLSHEDVEQIASLCSLLDERHYLVDSLELKRWNRELSPRDKLMILLSSVNDARIKRVHERIAYNCKTEGRPPNSGERELLSWLIDIRNLNVTDPQRAELVTPEEGEFYKRDDMQATVDTHSGKVGEVWLSAIPALHLKSLVKVV